MLCTGIFAIEYGEIAPDGGVATTFAKLGNTREGTLAFNPSEDQTQDIRVYEQDAPVLQVVTQKGTLDINWSMVDWDNTIMMAMFGGTVVNGQWHAPDQVPQLEKSLRITPKVGRAFIYPRVKVAGNVNFDDTGRIFQIDVKNRMLQPTKTGTPSFIWDAPQP